MPKKRANGEGSIRKRKDGRWEGRYTAGIDLETGKPIAKSVLARTQRECKEKLQKAMEELEKIDTVVPDLVGKSAGEAKNAAAALSLNAMIVGNGDKVLSQIPEASGHIPKGGTIILHTDSDSNSSVKVPKFIGLTMAEVNGVASSAGLNVKFSGSELSDPSIKVSSQSIEEGKEVQAGTIIELNFVHSDDVAD